MKDKYKARVCSKCIYFHYLETTPEQQAQNPTGECRKYPPNHNGEWPTLDADEFCGEFKNTFD